MFLSAYETLSDFTGHEATNEEGLPGDTSGTAAAFYESAEWENEWHPEFCLVMAPHFRELQG
jgi:hypothetical protein